MGVSYNKAANIIFVNQDDMWLILEMDKIPFFKNLTLQTKMKLLSCMEQTTFKKGDFVYKRNK